MSIVILQTDEIDKLLLICPTAAGHHQATFGGDQVIQSAHLFKADQPAVPGH